jgi:dTDP-D-glucose 4,6-dehydratase
MSLIDDQTVPLHGDGNNRRHYLAAPDISSAPVLLLNKVGLSETYNIRSKDEFANRDIARMICEQFDLSFDSSVALVHDRLFNDRR